MSDKSRMMVRLTPEDLAWVEEQAADEGVDNATLVRMVINRLRRGRPPLMRQALEAPARTHATLPAPTQQYAPRHAHERADDNYVPGLDDPPAPPIPQDEVEGLLAERLAEIGTITPGSIPYVEEPAAVNGAAISLRHVDRTVNNPGRS